MLHVWLEITYYDRENKRGFIMRDCHCGKQMDRGSDPYVANMKQVAGQNENFRRAIWTGEHLQMTVMCIPVMGDIGVEMHDDTDQFIRVEQGMAVVKMGKCRHQLEVQKTAYEGDAVFVPAGTWHNVVNIGRMPLKVSSIYAPPNHPKSTVHRTKEEAERAHY